MTLFQKALDYLGLGGDGAYVDYEDDIQDEPDYGDRQRVDQRDVRRGVPGPANRSRLDDLDGLDEMQSESAIRRQQEQHDSGLTLRPPGGRRAEASVRPIVASTVPITVCPQAYEEVKGIVDHFRRGTPVIIDLQDTDTRVMRRILDFASGVCYAQAAAWRKSARACL
jgi:cell division inhibitor SepF